MVYYCDVYYLHRYRVAIGIFALAVAVRLLFLPFSLFDHKPLELPAKVAYDGYYQLAESLRLHHAFTRVEPPAPDSVRTPLYPLIIATVVYLTGSYKIFLFLQMLLGSTIPLLGRKLAEMLLGSEKIAIATGIFLALEPFTAWLSTAILTETLFTFFFLAGCIIFFSFLRDKRTAQIVYTALLFGAATMIRPTIQFLPLIFCVVVLVYEWRPSRKRIAQLLLFFALFQFILFPWEYRNYRTFHNFNLNVQMTTSIHAYLVPSAIALEKHISFEQATAEFYKQEGATSIEEINLGNAAYYQHRALLELRRHPLGFLESFLIANFSFFTHDGYRTFTESYPWLSFGAVGVTAANVIHSPTLLVQLLSPGVVLIIAGRFLWLVTSILAVIGAYLFMREKRFSIESVLVPLMILYFSATSAIIGLAVTGRFRNPVNAFFAMFAALACVRLYDWYKKRLRRG